MKNTYKPSRRFLKQLVAYATLSCFVASEPAFAAATDISNVPLSSTSSTQVKPNIMYLMDTSGSMGWTHMPDDEENYISRVGYKAYQCNSIYYNPNTAYTLPKKPDGTDYPAPTFGGAFYDGYLDTATKVDLSANFKAYDSNTLNGSGNDTAQPAYYYLYTGTQTLSFNSAACTMSAGISPFTASGTGGGTWTKVLVSATSGPGGADEQQNFANWYSYYRTRILMMKSAATRAFVQLSDSYRVGMITINPNFDLSNTDTGKVDPARYLAISDFTATQKTAWWNKLTTQKVGQSTPLREALARVGRHYAGKQDQINDGMTGDPVQYSCQQNFTVLTTDGYWNGNQGVELDGTTAMGNEDNNLSLTPRPMWDGGTDSSVATTSKFTRYRSASCTTQQQRTTQIQKRTVAITQSTTQDNMVTSHQIKTTTTGTETDKQTQATRTTYNNARSTIIIKGNTSAGDTITRIRATSGGTSIFNSTVTAASGLGSALARNRDLAQKILAIAPLNNYTYGPTVTDCTGTDAPITGCSSTGVFITVVAPIGSGNVTTTPTASGSPTFVITAFSGGSSTPVSTTTSFVASCSVGTTPATTFSGNQSTSTTACSGPTTVATRPVTACAGSYPAPSSPNFITTTCVPVVTPVTVQNGTCVPSSNVTCTTSTPVTTGVAPGTCVVGDAASSPWENVTSCSTVTTGPTIIASCTASGPTSANSYVTTTCVNPASDTGFVNASSCTAGFVSGSGNVTCRTTDTGFVDVLSCTASSANGQTITCNNSVAGSKIQWQADTTVSTQKTSGGVSVGSPTVVTTLAGTTWNNLDNNCYAAAALPTLPTDGSPTPSLPPAPDPGCTAWPCTVTNTVDAGGSTGSLADVAEYYYRTDLRPTMTDNVQAAGSGPEEDTASWQHMTTFTMGLGLSGTLAYQDDYKTATTGDFALLRNGTKIWPVPTANNPTALDDLWHAAANGRGQFFSAADPDSVVNGLVTALSGIKSRQASAAAAATSNLEPIAGDNFAYTAKYVTHKWTGELEAHEIDLKTGAVGTATNWAAQALLDAKTKNACDNRKIYLYRDSATATDRLVDFTWNTKVCDSSGVPTGTASTGLDGTEQANFDSTKVALLSQWPIMTTGSGSPATADQRTPAAGANLVNFLRGQRGNEGFVTNDAAALYRARDHVLGDIIDAQPVYVKAPFASYTDAGYDSFKSTNSGRTPMVYVAANDGMLHAFFAGATVTDTDGGKEAWAFIPTMVLPNLYKLADNNYANNHAYFVDGTPTVGDIYDRVAATPAWKTILVAGLNSGGKGYYALDVTNPAAPKGLWEFKWSDTCYDPTDTTTAAATSGADCHIGYTFSNPVISKLEDGTWVVFVTSGYNNVNSSPKTGDGVGYLYVLNAVTGKIIYKISTGEGDSTTPSGLNHINSWVDNGLANNTTMRVYGADLRGNIWRFDVNDNLAPSGREATLVGTACSASPCSTTNRQPITTRPELAESAGTPMIFVATGRMVGASDLTDTQTQSIYGIKDPMTATTAYADLRASLKKMTITQVGSGTTATRTNNCTGSSSNCSSTSGWFTDLPDSGERVNVDMKLQLGTLVIASNVPLTDACTIGGYSWLNFLNYSTGTAVANSPGGAVAQFLSNSLAVGLNVVRLPDGKTVVITTTSDAKNTTVGAPFDVPAPTGKRISWREIVQ